MASYLRPRRGKKATAESQQIVLKRGEVFFECPDAGVGTGKGKIKVGDGATKYASLPYFMESFNINASDATIAFTDCSAATDYSNNATYLSNIRPANSVITLFTNLKQLLFNYNSQLTQLNNDMIKSYVGMIIISSSLNTQAKVINVYGGTTWELLKDRFLLGYGDTYKTINATGGEATHTLTIDEMPSHTHNIRGYITVAAGNKKGAPDQDYPSDPVQPVTCVRPTGGSQSHNNMPPYLVVYMWKRTV